MRKIITLSGASGVGKTTLAKWISEEYKIPFIELSTKPLWKDWGIQSHKQLIQKTIMEPNWGLAFQEAVLKMREKAFMYSGNMVCDRGAWDAWIYFLMQVVPFISENETNEYLVKCYNLHKYVTHNIFIRATGIPDIEDDGKRITNRFYQESFDVLMVNSLKTFGKDVCIIHPWDMEVRKQLVSKYINE